MENKWRYPTFVTGIITFVLFLVNIVPRLLWDSIHDTSSFIALLIISSFLISLYARSVKRNLIFWGLFNLVSVGLATVVLFFIEKKSDYVAPVYEEKQESIFRTYHEPPKIKIPKSLTKLPRLENRVAEELEKVLLQITDHDVVQKAKAIIEMGASAVPILEKHLLLRNKSQEIFTILLAMKSQAYPIIPSLVHFIEQGQHMQEAISILASIGNKSAVTIPLLSYVVKNTAIKKNIRAKAIEALTEIGELPQELYQLLILCCKEAPKQIAGNAVRSLGKLAPYSKDLESFLLETLSNSDITHATIEALQHIGTKNVFADRTFQNLLISEKDIIQKASEEALIVIAKREGIDTSVLENQDTNERIKLKLTTLFLKLEPDSELLFSILEQNYNSVYDKATKKDICHALEIITSESSVAIPFLLKLFRNTDEDLRKITKDKISLIKTTPKTIAALRKMVYDKDVKVQVIAAETLINILPTKEELLQFLTTALRNKANEVRLVAAQKLAEMSPNISAAITDLEKALSDNVIEVKNVVQKALDTYYAQNSNQ